MKNYVDDTFLTAYTETDPMWTANWTSYSTTTEITAQNTSQTNYINYANTTQATWTDNLFARLSALSNSLALR